MTQSQSFILCRRIHLNVRDAIISLLYSMHTIIYQVPLLNYACSSLLQVRIAQLLIALHNLFMVRVVKFLPTTCSLAPRLQSNQQENRQGIKKVPEKLNDPK